MTIEEYHLWKSSSGDSARLRRFARWLGIPGASFLPRDSLVLAVKRELARKR